MIAGMKSVETGDESVGTKDEYIEAGEKHNNRVIITYNNWGANTWIGKMHKDRFDVIYSYLFIFIIHMYLLI